MDNKAKNSSNQMTMGGMFSSFISSSIILAVTAFFTPGFEIASLGALLLAVVVYATQFFVAGYSISMMSAIIGAVIYGIIAAMIPGTQTM